MSAKLCVGCQQKVEDTLPSIGVATICLGCRVDASLLPHGTRVQRTCHACGEQTSFIGAAAARAAPPPHPVILYFDCPNPACAKRRMTIELTEVVVMSIDPRWN